MDKGIKGILIMGCLLAVVGAGLYYQPVIFMASLIAGAVLGLLQKPQKKG